MKKFRICFANGSSLELISITSKEFENLPLESKQLIITKEMNKLIDIQEEIRSDWVKHKKCSCVDYLLPNKILICLHVTDEIKKVTGKRSKELCKLSMELLKLNLKQNRPKAIYS